MDYIEAQKEALNVKWKVVTCSEGESCWCRIVVPIYKIIDDEDNEIYISRQGELDKIFAEHIVELHNKHLDNIL